MKSGMRVIIYSTTLLGWAQPGLAADCLFHNELTWGNNLSYQFTLGIMVALLAMIFGLKILHANKLKRPDDEHGNSLALDNGVCRPLKTGQGFSNWTSTHKMDEARPTSA